MSKSYYKNKNIELPTSRLVYVLILNWKSAQDTIECVESVQKSDYANYKILLIDNGSPDDSEEVLRARFPAIEFIQTGKNLGYAGGNNAGIRYAYAKGAEYVWILNPDVRISSSSMGLLVAAFDKEKNIGICGQRLIVGGKEGIVSYKSIKINPNNGFQIYMERSNAESGYLPTDFVMGCSMLISMELIKKIGLLREDFFLYMEEVEYCLRARALGWKMLICLDVADKHESGLFKKNRDQYYYLMARNTVILSRLQKKYLLQTAVRVLRLSEVGSLLMRGKVRDAMFVIKKKGKPVLEGLLKKLEKPKMLGDE